MHVCAVCSHNALHPAMSKSQSIAKARNKLTVDEKCKIARKVSTVTRMRRLLRAWFSQISEKHICRTVVGKAVRAGFHDLSRYEPDKICVGGVPRCGHY